MARGEPFILLAQLVGNRIYNSRCGDSGQIESDGNYFLGAVFDVFDATLRCLHIPPPIQNHEMTAENALYSGVKIFLSFFLLKEQKLLAELTLSY